MNMQEDQQPDKGVQETLPEEEQKMSEAVQTEETPEKEESRKEEEKPEQEKEEKAEKAASTELAEEYLNQLRRLQAEFENFRKREEKQRSLFKDLVTENIILELFPVIDNFERALEAANQENTTLESLKEGVSMVFQQLEGFLSRLDMVKIDALGKEFDPQFHDAVSKAPSLEYEEHQVSQVLRNGYSFHEKVIRPAMVMVSSGKPEDTETGANEEKKENGE